MKHILLLASLLIALSAPAQVQLTILGSTNIQYAATAGTATNQNYTNLTIYGDTARTNALYVGPGGVVSSNASGSVTLAGDSILFPQTSTNDGQYQIQKLASTWTENGTYTDEVFAIVNNRGGSVSSLPEFGFQMESKYAGATNTPFKSEWIFYITQTNGNSYRPFSFTSNHTNALTSGGMMGAWTWYDSSGATNQIIKSETGGLLFPAGDQSLTFYSNNKPIASQRNSSNTAQLNLPYISAGNRLTIEEPLYFVGPVSPNTDGLGANMMNLNCTAIANGDSVFGMALTGSGAGTRYPILITSGTDGASVIRLYNSHAGYNSHSMLNLSVAGNTVAGDPKITFEIPGGDTWAAGVWNGDNSFRISKYSDFNYIYDYFDINTAGKTTVSNLVAKTTITATNGLTSYGTATASNFVHSTWKWIDVLASGQSVASNPSGDPPVLTEVPGQNYFGYGYYFQDKSYFNVQGPHKLAMTNAANPALYFQPHLHVSTTNNTAGTNATFGLEMYYGAVHGYLTNYYASTNSATLTNTFGHYMINFGNVTNNALINRSSVIWRGRIMRVNGGDGDIGNSSPVWVDSIDIHVPVQEFGTIGQQGD